jgi:hypothetical protein
MIHSFLGNQSNFNVDNENRTPIHVQEVSQCNNNYSGWKKNYQFVPILKLKNIEHVFTT